MGNAWMRIEWVILGIWGMMGTLIGKDGYVRLISSWREISILALARWGDFKMKQVKLSININTWVEPDLPATSGHQQWPVSSPVSAQLRGVGLWQVGGLRGGLCLLGCCYVGYDQRLCRVGMIGASFVYVGCPLAGAVVSSIWCRTSICPPVASRH